MRAAKQYRVQRSDHRGVATRAFGGKVVSWSPWRTVAAFPTLEQADTMYTREQGRGLSRWRLMYGAEIKRQSL